MKIKTLIGSAIVAAVLPFSFVGSALAQETTGKCVNVTIFNDSATVVKYHARKPSPATGKCALNPGTKYWADIDFNQSVVLRIQVNDPALNMITVQEYGGQEKDFRITKKSTIECKGNVFKYDCYLK